MPSDLSSKRWAMIFVILPFFFGTLYLALGAAESPEPEEPEFRIVSFKVFFDERVRFPETVRQSTIKKLLGPGFEIVDHRTQPANVPVSRNQAGAEQDRDCKIAEQGGLLTLRIPADAVTADIALKLKQLSRIKTIVIYMNE